MNALDARDALAIKRGYPPEAHRVVCVDLDGTLFPFGSLSLEHDPFPGAAEQMQRLRRGGFRIVIFTSRLSPTWLVASSLDCERQRAMISDALTRHGIPFDDITAEKVPAIAYLDDRAIRVTEGELGAAVDWILWSDAE